MRVAEDGLSLIEALVAMAILAIVAVGLLRSTGTHVMRIDALETRAFAQFVAENHAAELTLAPAFVNSLPQDVELMGRTWQLSTVIAPTAQPELIEVVITVREVGKDGPVSRLSTFLDTGASP